MAETNDPFMEAVRKGDGEAVRRLLAEEPGRLDAAGPDGRTPLMLAASEGGADMVALLLELGADPAKRDREGRTAAELAFANGHTDLGQRLGPASEAERVML